MQKCSRYHFFTPSFVYLQNITRIYTILFGNFKWKKMIALIDLPFQKTSSNFSTSSSDYYLSFPLQIQNPRILSIFICSLQHDEVQIAFPKTKIFDLFLYSIKEKGKERSLLEISDQQHLSVVLVFI